MENILFLNKSISERRKALLQISCKLLQMLYYKLQMKATKRIVLLLGLNKLRKRKKIFP